MMYKLKNKLTNKTEVHKTLKSIGDKELIHAKTTIDGIKNIKITSTKISKSVKNFGYYEDKNYLITKNN